jgi:hypothetical protein
MWIIAGTKENTRRVPGGAKLERHCPSCGETTMFYEKEMTDTFRLYFIDVYDISKQRVMACGACGAHYATDEVGATSGAGAAARSGADAPVRTETLGDRVERGVQSTGARVGSFLERTADSLESGLNELLGGKPRAPFRVKPQAPDLDDPLADDPLDDPNEAKFRELERKAGIRK